MSAGKMLHAENFLCTDFKKFEGTLNTSHLIIISSSSHCITRSQISLAH